MHSKGKNVPAVGKRSRAIRLLKISSGITVPVSKRAKERCNAPRNSRPASALGRQTPALHNPTATVVEHALLTQGFRGASKAPFPRLFRPQNRDSTWENLANAPK